MAEFDDEISRILRDVTSETILQDAAKGDFAHVMKLKDYFVKCSPEIDNLLTAKCAVSKRNLIHWLAHHKECEILEWICGKDPRSLSSSSGSQGRHWPTIALDWKVSRKYFIVNAQDVYGFTALHIATWGGHEEIVKALLAYDTWVEVDVVAENMKDLDGNELKRRNGQTALHIAAADGKFSIVKMLLDFLKDRMQDRVFEGREEFREALSIKSASGKTALHYAAEHGKWEVVKCLVEAMKLCGGIDIVNNCDILRQTPLYLAVSHQNAEAVEILLREGEGLKVNTVTWEGITPLDKAKSNEADCQRKKPSPKFFAKKTEADCQRLDKLKKEEKTNQRIVVMLESYDVNWLHAERAKYANAANCLLVGAALIATVTYAGWLQPPLGITQYYEFPVSNAAAPPESFESYVGVKQHREIQLFWIFNSLSFFCSVATFIIGADAGIPKRCSSMREEVVQLRQSTVRASFILSFAIIGVIGAFSVAGISVLPPIERQRAPTYVTVALGMIFCLILLMQFMRKLWIWFWSPSLQFKLEKDGTSEELSPNAALLKRKTPNDGSLMPRSVDLGPSKPRIGDYGQLLVRSVDCSYSWPCTPRSADFKPPKPRNADSGPLKQRSANLGSPTPGSANCGQFMLGIADFVPSRQRPPSNGPLKQGRANALETSNSNALGKQKYDNLCEPFEEQQRHMSAPDSQALQSSEPRSANSIIVGNEPTNLDDLLEIFGQTEGL